jgi:hypothetical protein
MISSAFETLIKKIKCSKSILKFCVVKFYKCKNIIFNIKFSSSTLIFGNFNFFYPKIFVLLRNQDISNNVSLKKLRHSLNEIFSFLIK